MLIIPYMSQQIAQTVEAIETKLQKQVLLSNMHHKVFVDEQTR